MYNYVCVLPLYSHTFANLPIIEMLTQAQKKNIKQLSDKTFRRELNCFVAEGEKVVHDLLLSNIKVNSIFAVKNWINENIELIKDAEIIEIKEEELQQISSFKTANKVLAIATIPNSEIDFILLKKEFSIFLSNINDPGNLGTIIRTADWFGIKNIFCSQHTADAYNSKVIQSAMGSLFRVNIHYINNESFFEACKRNEIHIIGADIKGKSVYTFKFNFPVLLVMGSESHGIDEAHKKYIEEYVTVPGKHSAESLNVAIATGIICSEIMRSTF